MLSTCNLSAAQAENYFVKDDYYTEEAQHEASFWVGKGAQNLGLTGTVEKAVFGDLLAGVGPDGQALSGQKIDPKTRRAATDFTFSAPKSVSVAALVQQDERVLAAHHQAVAKALSVLEERYAQTRISTDTGRQRVTTGNLIAAIFPHATNREAEPQLHSHCVVMNATQLVDGRWFSFANEGAISNKKLLGQIYQNELAIALQNHGYRIEPKAHGQFELVGYSPELLKLFSTRRQQIESLVALWETEGKKIFSEDGRVLRSRLALYEAAALKSRKRKPTPMQPEQLVRGWNGLVQLADLVLPMLPDTRSMEREARSVQAEVSEIISRSEMVELAIGHCSEREAVFRRTALERFVFEHQLGQQSFDQLQQAISLSLELVQIDESRLTTQAAIRLELETIRLMREGQGQVGAITSSADIDEQLEGRSLTVEQRQAIQRVMTVPDRVMAWQGSAGAGKTYALNEVKAIAQAKGFEVRGFAPSAEAAHTLGESLKIETETVAGLLVSQVSEAKERSLWIVDESGLLSMEDAYGLLVRSSQENARVLLVGDTKQLSAVEAGNPFKSLQAGGIALTKLDHSLRQKTEELKLAVQLIAEGKMARGIDVLEQAGCLHIEPELSDQINQMVQDYLQLSPGARTGTLLLAGTNEERRVLTQKLRQALQREGSLGGDALSVLSLRRKDLTLVQAQYVSAYSLGDVLVPTQDYKKQGLVQAQQYVVRGIYPQVNRLVVETAAGQLIRLDPARCERKTVYAVQSVAVAVGDQLRWTKNDRAAKTRNGQRFTVGEIAADGKLLAVDEMGQSRWFDLSGRQYVDYAWVSTTYGSQGKTAARVLALAGEKTMSREAFYVAVSRAKLGLVLYAADKYELIRQVQVSRAKENASDYVLLSEVGEKGGRNAEAQKESDTEGRSSAKGRDIGRRVGDCLAKEFAGRASADVRGDWRMQSAAGGVGARGAGFDGELESLSDAVAGHVEREALIECEGEFAAAASAVNFGFEQLEWAAKNRNQLAAAVARFDAAVGEEAGKARSEAIVEAFGEEQRWSGDRDHGKLWQYYRQGVEAPSERKLDYRVGRRAFEDRVGQQDIALMLVAGSAEVKQIYERDGKSQAMRYVNDMAGRICQRQVESANREVRSRPQMELE
jgi:conjugative relaxase-like TrwC/TraI family protein